MSAEGNDTLHRSRHRRTEVVPLLDLAAGPAAWITQLTIGYAVAGHACRPGEGPAPAPPMAGWTGEAPVLILIQLACLAVTLVAGSSALTRFRRARGDFEATERARFLSATGALANSAFAVAIVFSLAGPLYLPTCWSYVP